MSHSLKLEPEAENRREDICGEEIPETMSLSPEMAELSHAKVKLETSEILLPSHLAHRIANVVSELMEMEAHCDGPKSQTFGAAIANEYCIKPKTEPLESQSDLSPDARDVLRGEERMPAGPEESQRGRKSLPNPPSSAAHVGRSHVCQLCEKSFIRRSHLKSHLRLHTGERPHICQLCSKSFVRIYDLRTHERTHLGMKPYACQSCTKTFSHLSSLRTHERTHSGEKPYVCQVCDKAFNRAWNLRTHGRIHSGEKPYACNLCLKSFSTRTSFRTHSCILVEKTVSN